MPEGHTIHRLAADLRRTFGDQPVVATSPQGRFDAGAALISGRPVSTVDAWGKYLFAGFRGAGILHVHLGLIGKFRPTSVAAEPAPTVRLRLAVDERAWDLIGPARCEVITAAERRRITAGLGADPLRRRSDPERARAALAATDRPIAATLLDQSIICGIGNVYRAELLFLSGLHPLRRSSSLEGAEFDALWSDAVRLLRIGRRLNRIVTTDPDEIGRTRTRMTAEDRLYVYHRDHCRRCGTEIATVKAGGRPIWFCPTCQPDI